MNYKFIIIILLVSTNLFCQKDMSVDIINSIDYSNILNRGFNSSDFETKGIYSYRVGANFNFRVFDKIMCRTGLRYAQIGENFQRNNLRWPDEITSQGFVMDPSLPRYFHSITRFRYIEIPLTFRYEYKNIGKFQSFVETGFSTNIYINTKNTSKSNISSSSEINNFKSLDGFNSRRFTLIFSVGFNYNLSDDYQLFAQPIIRYQINKMFTNVNASDVKYYSVGIEFGARYHFGKNFNNIER